MLRAIEWVLLGIGSAAAIVHGVRRHRPARTGPWLLLAGAIVASAAGDVLTALQLPGPADICFYVMFALVACSLLQLTRVGAILVDRARLIDLLAFACSTLMLVWVFVIGDAGQIGEVAGAYVIGALLLLAAQVLWGDETGVFDIQPVEAAKLVLTLLTAHCLALRMGWRADHREQPGHGARWLRLIAPALLFLALLGDALAARRPGDTEVKAVTSDGTLEVRLSLVPDGGTATIRTADGVLSGPEHVIEITDLTG